MTLLFRLIPLLMLLATAAPAKPDADDIGGRIRASAGDVTFDLPMMDTALRVEIEGDMATVEVVQLFWNPSEHPVEAEYLFPLNQSAAIYAMQMEVGDEVIEAQIREKHLAQAEFEQAASEGKSAALLTQHRPNMFTQTIANLMPGLPVRVTLRYVQMVPKIDDHYELVMPLVVGPRYQEPVPQVEEYTDADLPMAANVWSVSAQPAYPSVAGLDLPAHVTGDRVSLDLRLNSGLPITGFHSPSHPVETTASARGITARFADDKVMDNRDLVLRYALGGKSVAAAGLSHHDDRGGFVSVLIEPPADIATNQVTPREVVFVLDTSGSMSGAPMAASKVFMESALRGLRNSEYFRIIPFNNTTQAFSDTAMPATVANIRKAQTYVAGLQSGGGTKIDLAMRAAFDTAQPDGALRLVVFLSDGYIGNEATVLRTIHQRIGQARIYAFGIGSSVNRYLLDAMAEEGRGYARYVDPTEQATDVAQNMAASLKSPILTDISIDWGDLEVTDVTPPKLPDLFAGNTVRVYARHTGQAQNPITISGTVQGKKARMPVTVETVQGGANAALPLIWARNRIAALTRQVAIGDQPDAANKQITELGLGFSLQTQNTSFVAVSKKVVNASGDPAQKAGVPLPMVAGTTAKAYPSGFSGSSSPEPQTLFALIVVAVAAAFGLRRRLDNGCYR